jgi:hypothetical protein
VSLLLFGAIHGDEPASAALCERWLLALADQPLDETVLVIPALNPDGLAARRKDNAHGIDLNRNFPAQNFSLAHPRGYAPGPRPLSEPESAALMALLDESDPRVVVSVHQPLRCVNWDGPAAELAAAMATCAGLPARPSVGYPTPGSFGSLWGIDRGRSVITMELSCAPSDEELRAALAALEVARRWAVP